MPHSDVTHLASTILFRPRADSGGVAGSERVPIEIEKDRRMTRATHKNRAAKSQRSSHRRSNFIAILIASVAVSVLYLNFDSTLSGADADAAAADISRVTAAVAAPVIAMRPGAESSGKSSPSDDGQASGRIALLLNLLLLEKGRDRF